MSRLLLPALGVLGLAALIGCGGDGGGAPSFGDDPTTTGTPSTTGGDSTSGDSTSGSLGQQAASGTYGVLLTGTLADGTTLSGTGTGSVATDGALTLDYTAATVTATPVTTKRRIVATVASTGVATGTVAVGSEDALSFTGTLTRSGDGSPRLVAQFTRSEIEETDVLALTLRRPSAGTYDVVASGTDDRNGVYTGSGVIVVPASGNISGGFTTSRRIGTTKVTQIYDLNAALAEDGALTGTLGSGSFASFPTSGRLGQSANGVPRLALNYTTLGLPGYVVTQTLALTRR